MPPKVRFGREEILEAAFILTRKEGLKKLTARNIAKEAKSSTAPVYSCFTSMEEVKIEVLKRIKKIMYSYTFKEYTENNFLNIGIGVVYFAKEESTLFNALFSCEKLCSEIFEEMTEEFLEEMNKNTRYKQMGDKMMRVLFEKMLTYTYGFAQLTNAGFLNDNKEEIVEKLRYIGKVVTEDLLKDVM